MKKVLWSITGLVIISVGIVWLWADGIDQDRDRAFDPETIVEYRILHSYAPYSFVYSLRNDGQLSMKRYHPSTKKVAEHRIVHLDFASRYHLIKESVVDQGLMECGTKCIETQIIKSLGVKKVPRASDAATVILSVNLEADASLASEARVAQQRVRIHSLDMLKRYCPEIAELQALDRFGRELHRLALDGQVQP